MLVLLSLSKKKQSIRFGIILTRASCWPSMFIRTRCQTQGSIWPTCSYCVDTGMILSATKSTQVTEVVLLGCLIPTERIAVGASSTCGVIIYTVAGSVLALLDRLVDCRVGVVPGATTDFGALPGILCGQVGGVFWLDDPASQWHNRRPSWANKT